MLKLLICIIIGMLTALAMLQLRQQRLELMHDSSLLHSKLEATQSRLWNQQLQIAVYTAPNAIQKTVGDHNLKLRPLAPVGQTTRNWIDGQVPATAH